MKYIFCTLFEGAYHLGAAVLVNSLCKSGYSGTVYAGFRGPLPPWAEGRAQSVAEGRWEMAVTPEVRLVFLRLDVEAHFTNYKPDFLLQLETLAASESDGVVYCDPDIVVNTDWSYIEDWLSCGVAVCEDLNSPCHENDPGRVGRRRFFQPFGYELRFRTSAYANGGFVGISWQHRQFLVVWQRMMELIGKELGGRDVVGLPAGSGGRKLSGRYGFADCFRTSDQDALNAVLEACPDIPVSFLGGKAMGFLDGYAILPHAAGVAKPWVRRYLIEALGARPPEPSDKIFWRHVDGPLRPFTSARVKTTRLALTIGAALGRFMKRT